MRSQMRFLFSYLGVITFLVLLIPRYRDMKFFGIERIIFYLKCSWNSYFLISSSQIWLLVRRGGEGDPDTLMFLSFLTGLAQILETESEPLLLQATLMSHSFKNLYALDILHGKWTWKQYYCCLHITYIYLRLYFCFSGLQSLLLNERGLKTSHSV